MYLRHRDYAKQIQDINLNQVISNDDSIRILCEGAAQEELASYLVQKYDISDEFAGAQPFSMATTYFMNTLVELDFPLYSPSATYDVGDVAAVLPAGALLNLEYVCTTAVSSPSSFNPSSWRQVGTQYDLLYVAPPYPEFQFNYGFYNIGDRITYRGKIYQALKGTVFIDHETYLNSRLAQHVPVGNIFPDDPQQGAVAWGTGVAYSLGQIFPNASAADYTAWSSVTTYTAGNIVSYNGSPYLALQSNTDTVPGADITNWQINSWTKGDNRSQQLVMMGVDICLYHLHSRISPRNVPEVRTLRYRLAKEWLQGIAKGTTTPTNLDLLQPVQGEAVRAFGNVKTINTY